MKPSELKVGDRIRILKIPGEGIANYTLHRDTKRVYKKLIARGKSVRICRIDEFGSPWYRCRFRTKDGEWERHWLAVCDWDNNWVVVKHRRERRQ